VEQFGSCFAGSTSGVVIHRAGNRGIPSHSLPGKKELHPLVDNYNFMSFRRETGKLTDLVRIRIKKPADLRIWQYDWEICQAFTVTIQK
jgi:hypothetical protein